MALGDSSQLGALSCMGIGRETAFGTAVTTTAGLEFLSSSMKVVQESKILEQIEKSRTMSKHIRMGKRIEGDVEYYLYAQVSAVAYLLQNAFGGTMTAATATDETVGGLAFEHDLRIGSMDQKYQSLTINLRKGDATGGKVFEYYGARTNEFTIAAELDEPVKITSSFIAQNETQTSNDISAALTQSTFAPLDFIKGRLSVESTFASLTASSFWHITNMEFTLTNNLKGDNE